MDEENIYVICLTKDSKLNPMPSFITVHPSEELCSSSLVCGLRCVHIILGILAASFTILVLFANGLNLAELKIKRGKIHHKQ